MAEYVDCKRCQRSLCECWDWCKKCDEDARKCRCRKEEEKVKIPTPEEMINKNLKDQTDQVEQEMATVVRALGRYDGQSDVYVSACGQPLIRAAVVTELEKTGWDVEVTHSSADPREGGGGYQYKIHSTSAKQGAIAIAAAKGMPKPVASDYWRDR